MRRAVCELSEGGNGEQRRLGAVGMTYADMHEGLADFLKFEERIFTSVGVFET